MKQMIGVLAGGDSPERAVSLLSGKGVLDALRRLGYESRLVEIESLDDLVPSLRGIDIAFNCLHGGSGKDGTVQLLLDVMGIPYTGSGPLACARALDKEQAKAIFRSKDLPTPAGISLDRESMDSKLQAASEILSFPMILKPQSGGSTIAVYCVETAAELPRAAEAILADFDTVLVETFIAGRELTVGILMIEEVEVALPVIEIRFSGSLFDYAAKYTDGQAQFLAPAPLSLEETLYVQDIALRAHQALGCHAYSRVDLRMGADGIAYLLEVNTLPGMTPLSDLPRAAAVHGIEYDELVDRMLATAARPQA